MKKYLKTLPYLLIAILVGVTIVYAAPGSKLTPPGAVSNTMYSLTDIWNLATGTTAIEGTGAIETTPSLAETGKSLTDVYTAISGEIAKLTPSVLLSGNTIFGVEGEATAGTPAPVFASADVNSYDCSWFTTMTDSTQPGVTSAQICAFNTGCSWVSNACTGGVKTGKTYVSWYAGKAACANSTEGGQTAGTWHLPTYGQLVDHYVNNNTSGGNPPTGFAGGNYWSGTTYPGGTSNGYYVSMIDGYAGLDNKSSEYAYLARCSR